MLLFIMCFYMESQTAFWGAEIHFSIPPRKLTVTFWFISVFSISPVLSVCMCIVYVIHSRRWRTAGIYYVYIPSTCVRFTLIKLCAVYLSPVCLALCFYYIHNTTLIEYGFLKGINWLWPNMIWHIYVFVNSFKIILLYELWN